MKTKPIQQVAAPVIKTTKKLVAPAKAAVIKAATVLPKGAKHIAHA